MKSQWQIVVLISVLLNFMLAIRTMKHKISLRSKKIPKEFIQIGFTHSGSHPSTGRAAITESQTNDDCALPHNHPIFEHLKAPKYIEQVHYYEDPPEKDPEREAISIDKLNNNDDVYYNPSWKRSTIKTNNCGDIDSAYICTDTLFCSWDALVQGCVFNESKIQIVPMRFLQKKSKRKSKY